MMIIRSRCTRVPATLLLIFLSVSPLLASDFIDANYTWNPPVEGSPVVHYVVQHSINGGPFMDTAEVLGESCLVPLEMGGDHQIRVAGVDGQDHQGPWSLSSDVYRPEVLINPPPEYLNGYLGELTIANGNQMITGKAYLDNIQVVECYPGGSLEGDIHIFAAKLIWEAIGAGDFEGFGRQIAIPLSGEIHTSARALDDPVQNFTTNIFRLHGRLEGDPDFEELEFQAGSAFDLSSTGFTNLTQLGDGSYLIDSILDLSYQLAYNSNSESLLAGLDGVTEGSGQFVAPETRVFTDVVDNEIPMVATLSQNTPNPFNPRTVIQYELPQGGSHVVLDIFDIRGRQVNVLVNESQLSGVKTVSWDGIDGTGRQVPAGVYFYRLNTSEGNLIRKMTLVK